MQTLELDFERQQPGYEPEIGDFEVDREEIERQARELLANRERVAYPEMQRQERVDNARTALMEALTASGHLSRVELHAETLEGIHEQVLSRLLRGYDDDLPNHEKWRRFYEICEELTIYETHKAIQAGEAPASTAVAVVSDYPELDALQATKLGYRPQNKKGMVRSTHLVQHLDGSFTRVIEQVSRSQSGSATTFRLLEIFDQEASNSLLPADIAALAQPFAYDVYDLHDGVVDLQRMLDEIASGQAGYSVRYGEKTRRDQLDYDELRQGSIAREQQVELYSNRLANYEERLDRLVAAGQLSHARKEAHYKQEVLQILRAVCAFDVSYAKDCFGEAAAKYYEQAGLFHLLGNTTQRDVYLEKAAHVEQPVMYCGVMISAAKAKELGITNSETGELMSEGKDKWGYKTGYCRVSACENKGKKTQIGPCSVCKKCEKLFDKGILK